MRPSSRQVDKIRQLGQINVATSTANFFPETTNRTNIHNRAGIICNKEHILDTNAGKQLSQATTYV